MAATTKRTQPTIDDLLDELLPQAVPEQIELHTHAALLEVDEPIRLLELAKDPAIRSLLLCRLAPTVALVDPGSVERLLEFLRRRGHTPKVTGA